MMLRRLRHIKTLLSSLAIGACLSVQTAFAQTGAPLGSSPIISALSWIQSTLLGQAATIVAVIAVAMVGFMMLTGRMDWKRGATVILGCFILFGAASIVAGIQGAAH